MKRRHSSRQIDQEQFTQGETLRSIEARFHLFVASVVDYAIVMLDPQGNVVSWNAGAERLKGYAAAEIIGSHFSRFYPGEDAQEGKPDRELRIAAREGRFEDSGWRVRKGGTPFWANVVITALRDDRGKLVGFGKVTRDLTERMRADAALRESEQKFRLLVESVQDYAIFLLDTRGTVLSWNSGAEQIKGYKASEIIGQNFSLFYPNEDVRKHRPEHELEVAATSGRFEDDGWRVRKDGSKFWANVIISPIRDEAGHLKGFSKLTRDLTERMRADAALREREEMLSLLVDSVKDYAIFILDPKGTVLSWNSGAERLKGYKSAEIIGQNFAKFYPAEDVKKEKPEHELQVAAQAGRFEDEGLRVRKDGSQFLANVIISAIRDEKGNLRGFSKLTRDLTETKQFQALLETLRATFNILDDFAAEKAKLEDTERATFNILDDFAGEREKLEDLQRAAFNIMEDLGSEKDKLGREILERERVEANLETTNKELEAFSYSVSHDLRAPLRGIDGFSQLLLENYSKAFDEKGRSYLRFVREASQEMAQLIDDLLNLSRMTRSEMHREQVDLSAIALSVIVGLKARQPERRVETVISPGLVANCDARLLRIALENLLGNAWKFTSNKGGALIEFGASEKDGIQVFFVRDNGAGFDMAYSKKLFGAFQRLHTGAEFPGTGIGLATVRRIIHRHGGKVWAEAEFSKGATFFFTLGT